MHKHSFYIITILSLFTVWSMSALVAGDTDSIGNICLTKRFPTLMYHHVRDYADLPDKAARDISVSPDELREQVNYLKKMGYQTITPRDITDNTVPCNAIMITFDDGYYDNYTDAFPILEKSGYTGVISLIAAHLDESDYLTGDHVRDMQKNGWEIASHTWTHTFLHQEPVALLPHEIIDSKKNLEKWFETPISTLVYPGGYYGHETLKITRNAGYQYAFTTQFGESDLSGSRLELRRIHIDPGTSIEKFAELLKKAKTMQ